MTAITDTTVADAREALSAAMKALEAAQQGEAEVSAWVDHEREDLATGAGSRSELIKAQRHLAKTQEERIQAEAGVAARQRRLLDAQHAAVEAARRDFYAVRTAIKAAYADECVGVMSLTSDIRKLLATAADALRRRDEQVTAIAEEFSRRGVATASLPRIRAFDADPHLTKRLYDALEALHDEYLRGAEQYGVPSDGQDGETAA